MLVSVESTDSFNNSALAVDCSDEEFGTLEASLYQVLPSTTANELRIVQQPKGQKGFEAWRTIAGRYDQRNMSEFWQGSELERKWIPRWRRWHKCKSGRKELMAGRQWPERKQGAG